jgi:dTDP-4-amino-4,6-dideoxygalactose transaminase
MILFERRACGILYNLLLSREDRRPFLLPANTCPVVPLAFRQAGHPFFCVDIDPVELTMDPRRCLRAIEERPEDFGGILFVRTYGVEKDFSQFFRGIKEIQPDFLIIDDKCLCPPDCDGERLSPDADVTLFSTGRAKPVDLGFGGFARCREGVSYRPFEGESWLDLSAPGLGWDAYRTAIQQALPRVEEHRRRLNAIYTSTLPEEIQLPARFQGWRFHILVPEPDRLVERLFAAGLFASRHYASLGGIFCEERFPEAERLHRGIVNLFNDMYFDEERARRTVDCVLRHLAGCGHPEG